MLQTLSQNIQYFFLFHYNNSYTNAPQCYVIRPLPLFLLITERVTFWPWNSTVRTALDICTGFIPTQLMTNISGCFYSL